MNQIFQDGKLQDNREDWLCSQVAELGYVKCY